MVADRQARRNSSHPFILGSGSGSERARRKRTIKAPLSAPLSPF
jgi:hypothetical protein